MEALRRVAEVLALAHTRAKGAETLWQGKAQWHVIRDDSFGDWAGASPSGWMIHDTLSALIHPRQACAALVAALQANGVPVLAEGQAQGRTIWATGAQGLAQMSANHHRLVEAVLGHR